MVKNKDSKGGRCAPCKITNRGSAKGAGNLIVSCKTAPHILRGCLHLEWLGQNQEENTMTKVGQLFADEMERKLNEREAQTRRSDMEIVLKNLQTLHPEWSKTRTQREADVLFAR